MSLRTAALASTRQFEGGCIEQWHGCKRAASGTDEKARSCLRDRPREQPVRDLQPKAGTPKELDGSGTARRLDTNRSHHVTAPADVRVGDDQPVQLRFLAQSRPGCAQPVEPRDRHYVTAELVDHATRVCRPLAIRRTRRLGSAPGQHGNDDDCG
jgi:hypothetical protein